jgi:hypothetical protein
MYTSSLLSIFLPLLFTTYPICLITILSIVLDCVIARHWDNLSSDHGWKRSEQNDQWIHSYHTSCPNFSLFQLFNNTEGAKNISTELDDFYIYWFVTTLWFYEMSINEWMNEKINNVLTPWNQVFLEKLLVTQLIKFPTLYETRRSIQTCHWSLSHAGKWNLLPHTPYH